jgi:ATP-dependent helicase HepA
LVPVEPWFDRIESSLDRALTFDRGLAANKQTALLVRSGRSIVDVLPLILRYDDRGTAFATWRCASGWVADHGEWVVFRLGFVVEVDIETEGDVTSKTDVGADFLRRRVDSLMPPWLETIYLDSDLRPVVDPELVKILQLPYDSQPDGDKRRDFNLSSRPRTLSDRVPPDQLASLSQSAADRARDLLSNSESYKSTLGSRVASAQSTLNVLKERIDRRERANRLHGVDEALIRRERAQIDRLGALCTRIAPRLDSAGLFIIAASPPTQP